MDDADLSGSSPSGTDIQTELLLGCDAVLLGKHTYTSFASVWQGRSGDPYTDQINAVTKYVVSTTLDAPDWQNTVVIRGDVPAEVGRIKDGPGKDIATYGFGTLARTLLDNDLLDEVRLWVHPLFVGAATGDGTAVRPRPGDPAASARHPHPRQRHRRPVPTPSTATRARERASDASARHHAELLEEPEGVPHLPGLGDLAAAEPVHGDPVHPDRIAGGRDPVDLRHVRAGPGPPDGDMVVRPRRAPRCPSVRRHLPGRRTPCRPRPAAQVRRGSAGRAGRGRR